MRGERGEERDAQRDEHGERGGRAGGGDPGSAGGSGERAAGEAGASAIDGQRLDRPKKLLRGLRSVGGALFLTGAVICAFNVRATMLSAPAGAGATDRPLIPQAAE